MPFILKYRLPSIFKDLNIDVMGQIYKNIIRKVSTFVIGMKSLSPLYSFIFKYKTSVLRGALFILISSLLNVLPPRYVGKIISLIKNILNFEHEKEDFYQLKESLFFYISLIIILPIINGIIKYYTRKLFSTTSRRIEFDMKNQIYDTYQKLDFLAYKKYTTGDLMNRLSEDMGNVRTFLGPGLMFLLSTSTLILITATQMLRVDALLSFYVLLPIFCICIGAYFFSKKIYKKNQSTQRNQSLLSSFIEDVFSGIYITKAFALEEYFKGKHQHLISSYKRKSINLSRFEASLSFIITFFIGLSQLLILYVGGKKYISGETEEIGVLAEFFIYVNMLMWNLAYLGWPLSIMQKAASSKSRIEDFLMATTSLKKKKIKKVHLKGDIEFKNVSFIHQGAKLYTLEDISFHLKEGQTLGILGGIGSGKSTLAQLLCGLLKASKGKILIDGQDIDHISLDELRESISYTFQESFLFSESIYDTILAGSQINNRSQVDWAAKKAQIQEDILRLKDKYETLLSQGGSNLSGGQKQRLSIARTLLRNSPIVIFDDSFSAIDQKTRSLILSHIKKDLSKKTILIITHDIAQVQDADELIILNKGKIVERGSPKEFSLKTERLE